MKRLFPWIVPLLVVLGGVVVSWFVLTTKHAPPLVPVVSLAPLVRAALVRSETLALDVTSHGTVLPRTESRLVPQVAGRVEWLSPAFVAGGFFERGEPLLRLDPRDYELAVVQARANVAQAELDLALEQQEAAVARAEWDAWEQGPADPLVLREPQLARARALLEASRARLEQALIDVQRTTLAAPYAGRVRTRSVDLGQYVQPGLELAVLYAVDKVEIRLPVPDGDLAFLDLPLGFREAPPADGHLAATIAADFAGRRWSWPGRIVRTEGQIDARTRMVHLVAEVDDPYGPGDDKGRPPLAVGLFVSATLHGRNLVGALVIPREALRGADQVYVIDAQDRLRVRTVRPLRVERERVVVAAGLEPGERICTSILETVVDGMPVRVERQAAVGSEPDAP